MTSTCLHSHPPPDVGFVSLGGVLLTCDIYFLKPDDVNKDSVSSSPLPPHRLPYSGFRLE